MTFFNETIWAKLVNAAKANKNVIFTLTQQRKNVITRDNEDGFLVITKSDPQLVLKTWIADAWNAFVKNGSLQADDLPGQARHRSSFIMALFALLPEVKVLKTSPVTIKWDLKSDDFEDQTTWIFQGNPRKFDIESYITERKYIWWSLRQQNFERQIRTGDEVFLWRTETGQSGSGGLIAKGVIIGPPIVRIHEDAKQYWKSEEWKVPGLGVPIELLDVRVSSGFIPRRIILQNEILSDLLIVRMANQTNYKINKLHAAELHKVWGKSDTEYTDDYEEAMLFQEGKRAYRKHRVIERNPHLIKAAKEKYKEQNKDFRCMACGFSFIKQYGSIGEDFIEAHHTTPISEMAGEYHAKIEDIALVCSNCHRMLHRRRPWLKMEELKNILST